MPLIRHFLAVLFLSAVPAFAQTTVQRIDIDPLGAESEVPWIVHLQGLQILDTPSSGTANILGTLPEGIHIHGDYCLVEETDEEWLRPSANNVDLWISRSGITRPHPKNLQMIEQFGDLPYGEELVNRWWGIPLDYEPSDLVDLPEEYGRRGIYPLRAEAAKAYIAMADAARAEGVVFYVGSSYRSGERQRQIYGRSTRRRPNQRSSAPPGHSEHQLGTTCDISREEGGFLRNGDPEHEWLKANGHRFGWRQTYLADNRHQTGYIEEPWHWRYTGTPKPE